MSVSVKSYELTPKALGDLVDIWRYSAETWSMDQADRYIDDFSRIFDLLVSMPAMARERHEFHPPVRIPIHAEHLIIYTLQGEKLLIIRVLGGGQTWKAILENTQ